MGVGTILPKELAFENTTSITVCHPKSPKGTCKPADGNPDADVMEVLKQRELETQKKLKDAESWRSNTPIASWSAASPSGNMNVIKVFGYNKELGAVWINEGENSRAADSMLASDAVLSAKFPEWVAAKASLGKSSALPILLGAAYLLLS